MCIFQSPWNEARPKTLLLYLFSQDLAYNNVASAILEPSCFILFCFWYLLLPSWYASPSYFCLNVSIHSIDLVLGIYVLLFWSLIMSSSRLMHILACITAQFWMCCRWCNAVIFSPPFWGKLFSAFIHQSSSGLRFQEQYIPEYQSNAMTRFWETPFLFNAFFSLPCLCKQIRNVTVDGGFGAWSGWSTCSHNDGGSAGSCLCRTRACDNPAPQCGGQQCHGISVEVANCSRWMNIYAPISS